MRSGRVMGGGFWQTSNRATMRFCAVKTKARTRPGAPVPLGPSDPLPAPPRMPDFLALATAAHAETVRWRRHLHRTPELSFEEHETAAFIAATLREIGLDPIEGVGGTGVVAHVRGGRRGRSSPSAPTSTRSPSTKRPASTSRARAPA